MNDGVSLFSVIESNLNGWLADRSFQDRCKAFDDSHQVTDNALRKMGRISKHLETFETALTQKVKDMQPHGQNVTTSKEPSFRSPLEAKIIELRKARVNLNDVLGIAHGNVGRFSGGTFVDHLKEDDILFILSKDQKKIIYGSANAFDIQGTGSRRTYAYDGKKGIDKAAGKRKAAEPPPQAVAGPSAPKKLKR